jgi:hypothetical protein
MIPIALLAPIFLGAGGWAIEGKQENITIPRIRLALIFISILL